MTDDPLNAHEPYCPNAYHPYKIAQTCPVCHAIRYARADEREAIAAAIEATDIIRVEVINGQAIPLVNLADTAKIARYAWAAGRMSGLDDAARIARGGGRDE